MKKILKLLIIIACAVFLINFERLILSFAFVSFKTNLHYILWCLICAIIQKFEIKYLKKIMLYFLIPTLIVTSIFEYVLNGVLGSFNILLIPITIYLIFLLAIFANNLTKKINIFAAYLFLINVVLMVGFFMITDIDIENQILRLIACSIYVILLPLTYYSFIYLNNKVIDRVYKPVLNHG